jgi:hypothetical protein
MMKDVKDYPRPWIINEKDQVDSLWEQINITIAEITLLIAVCDNNLKRC